MSGQRQSVELVLAKGSKHLTKKKTRRKKAQRSNLLLTIFLRLRISVPKKKKKKNRKRSLTGLLISDLARAILLSKLS